MSSPSEDSDIRIPLPLLILAGGLATRLQPVTNTLPKSLVPVAGKPFLDHQLFLLKRSGFKQVLLCAGHFANQIKQHISQNATAGLNVVVVEDGPELLGTGGAVFQAAQLLKSDCCVIYGDSYLEINYRLVYEMFQSSPGFSVMTIFHNENRREKSNVKLLDDNLIIYDKNHCTDMDYVDYGFMILRQGHLALAPNSKKFDLAELLKMISTQGLLKGFCINRPYFEIGSIEGINELEKHLLLSSA